MKTILALLLAGAPLLADPPAIKLPKEVHGEPGDWIIVTADTPGKHVRWVGMTPGLRVFPPHLLKDSHSAVVVSGKPGRFKLLAYTAAGDEPSDPAVVTVVVEGETPVPPDPGPGPGPKPPTPPVDPFTAKVQAALASDPGTSADKAKHAAALAGFYSAMAKHVESDAAATVGDLLSDYRAAIPSVLPEGAIPATRKLCGSEVAAVVGDDAERKIDKGLKDQLVGLFTKLSKALEVK
ncbi:MAG TPA: hypothetical protein VEA69_21260 [Tepidisphaeraceae bacterium]|nr:hypothetical protein [Tepidisphaeraceae bacterium]